LEALLSSRLFVGRSQASDLRRDGDGINCLSHGISLIAREAVMSGKWMGLVLGLGLATTLVNLAILAGQISTPAIARAPSSGAKLLEDDDFTSGLSKIIRKTVRDYCTVGKRNAIDC
jgi:hypothetical protein